MFTIAHNIVVEMFLHKKESFFSLNAKHGDSRPRSVQLVSRVVEYSVLGSGLKHS